MVRLIPIFLISIVLLISPISAYTNLTECGELNITGETYYLIQNISYIYNCMEITAENVILDCQGYTIDGTGGGEQIGIFVSNNSIEVRNCNLKGWGFSGIAIVLAGTNANIYDNNINVPLNGYGISNLGEPFGTSNNTIQNNLIFNGPGGQYPLVSLYNTNYNIISNNTIDYGGEGRSNPSVFIEDGYSNIISYNNVTSIQNEGDSNTISYNNINYIALVVGDSNTISYNNITYMAIAGDSNYLTNNRIINTEENSVTLVGSSNQITDNYISTGEAYGIEITGDSNEIVRNEIYSEVFVINAPSGSDNNKIYNNLFSSLEDITGTGVNIWNTERQQGTRIYGVGNEIGGNYWTNEAGTGYSDTCEDLNRDGFCDVSYVMLMIIFDMDGVPHTVINGTDYYPLSNKYLQPSAPAPALIEIPESYCGDGTCDYELEYKETHISCPQDCPACGFEIYPSNLEFIIPPTEQCLTKPLKVRWTCEQLPTQYFFAIPPDSLITSPKNKQSISFKRYQKRYTIWYEAITNFTVCKIPTDTNELFQRVTTYIENQTKPDIYLRAGYEGNTINSYIPIEIKLLGQYTTECGNGICEAGENAINCPKDCKVSELPWYLIIGFIAILIMFVLYHIK